MYDLHMDIGVKWIIICVKNRLNEFKKIQVQQILKSIKSIDTNKIGESI